MEEINLRWNLYLFFQFLFYIFLCFLWSFSNQQPHPVHGSSEMQQQLASTSNPLSHSCGIGNVCGCTLFLPAPIMPTIGWVRRLNQEKGEKRGIKTADLGIYTLSILLCLPQNDILGNLRNILLLAVFKNIYFIQLFFTQWCC